MIFPNKIYASLFLLGLAGKGISMEPPVASTEPVIPGCESDSVQRIYIAACAKDYIQNYIHFFLSEVQAEWNAMDVACQMDFIKKYAFSKGLKVCPLTCLQIQTTYPEILEVMVRCAFWFDDAQVQSFTQAQARRMLQETLPNGTALLARFTATQMSIIREIAANVHGKYLKDALDAKITIDWYYQCRADLSKQRNLAKIPRIVGYFPLYDANSQLLSRIAAMMNQRVYGKTGWLSDAVMSKIWNDKELVSKLSTKFLRSFDKGEDVFVRLVDIMRKNEDIPIFEEQSITFPVVTLPKLAQKSNVDLVVTLPKLAKKSHADADVPSVIDMNAMVEQLCGQNVTVDERRMLSPAESNFLKRVFLPLEK